MTQQLTQNRPVVSIVLPTFNEKGNIERLIETLCSLLSMPVEYIVVDDDSPDGTAEAVDAMIPFNPNIRLVVRKDQRGLVSALQRGIDESRGEIIVWMDCDFSLPPEKVPELISMILDEGYDVAIGSRYIPGGADETEGLQGWVVLCQKVATSMLNQLTRLIMQTDFHDWTSGFIAIKSSIIKQIPLHGDYGEYFILMMARLIHDGRKWVEVPYRNVPRTIGSSKTAGTFLGLFIRGIRYYIHIFKAWRVKNSQRR
ncbi:MAG: glycosyltransferase [Proteobacteria bacterium]|nr:glycosyltransferase [Pseudomonadota bacterium]MBU1686723.1 glycosyltransferase [Pseudomonadota bacterium]